MTRMTHASDLQRPGHVHVRRCRSTEELSPIIQVFPNGNTKLQIILEGRPQGLRVAPLAWVRAVIQSPAGRCKIMTIPELLPGSPKLGMVKFSLCSITDDLIKVFQNASGLHQSQIGSLALTANFLNLKNEVAKSLRPFRKPPLRSMSGLWHQSYNMRRRVQNDNVNCCGDTHARTHANLYARTHARTHARACLTRGRRPR